MDRKLLEMLESDGRLSAKQIAMMLSKEEGDIKKMIEAYENDGVILGYRTVIDWDKTNAEYVTAMIELKTTPQRGHGYDHVAEKLATLEDVISTSTHFMLRKYKDNNVIYGAVPVDERGNII